MTPKTGAYQHILLAIDLTEESEAVARKACALVHSFEAKLSIAHVIEPLSFAYGGDVPMDLSAVQEQVHQQAEIHLQAFATPLKVGPERQHILFGRPETEIHRIADEQEADLIVVGSHGRHGLALLLGSTANGVLHGASCDVLAVRIGE